MFSVIVTNSWKFSIFVTILVLARLQSIPDSIYEAAAVSGASPIRRFIDITLPNLKGVLFIAILLRGIWMFNKFDIVYILTGGGPASRTLIAPIYAYRTAFVDNQLGEAAAVSALLFIVLLGVALIYFYVFEPSQEVRVE
jgi:multiple sugar transport system permease protein